MKIGLDATVFANGQYTGIPKSVYEIIKYWKDNYPEHEYYLISSVPVVLDFDLPDNFHVVRTTFKNFVIRKLTRLGKLYDLFVLPYIINKLGLDVYWGTNYVLPVFKNKNTKYIVTIYDLALFKINNISQNATKIKQKLLIKPTLNNADKIVAISEATKKDIIELFDIDNNKIEVSYCGKDEDVIQKNNIDKKDVNPKLIFDEDYYLFISTIEPRKNIITIVKAFDDYIDKTNKNTKLVLAGKIGWKCEDILKTIDNAIHKDQIIMPGYISDNDKQYLLSNAKAFLYPSIYEGFGLPILEAFNYGLPVITANNSSLPEVGGDAAFYLQNTYDYKELSNLIETVDNLTQKEKKQLNIKINNQLKKFSWHKNAIEMMDIINKL